MYQLAQYFPALSEALLGLSEDEAKKIQEDAAAAEAVLVEGLNATPADEKPTVLVDALDEAEKELAGCAPLVFAGEVRTLQEELGRACMGDGFVLFGGDCAESFDEFSVDHVRDTFRVILQMALVMTYGGAQPVIKIGRMAGQFAKPRSSPTEKVTMEDGSVVELPSYKGDNINLDIPTAEARVPNPQLMLRAYHQCAQTLNILRAFAVGGYADISRLHAWNLDFVEQTKQGSNYRAFSTKVDESLRFMKAIGVDTSGPKFRTTEFYTAHECLLLQYEQALTREDSTTVRPDSTGPGNYYGCSANMLWIGERTRQLDCGHLQYVRGLKNPLGVKISNKCENDELLELLDIINPDNIPGRVTLIIRMGNENIRDHLPRLVKAVEDAETDLHLAERIVVAHRVLVAHLDGESLLDKVGQRAREDEALVPVGVEALRYHLGLTLVLAHPHLGVGVGLAVAVGGAQAVGAQHVHLEHTHQRQAVRRE